MTTLSIRVLSVCSGGEHGHTQAMLDGGEPQTFTVGFTDLRAPFDDVERAATVLSAMKLAIRGLNNTEARAKLQAGFTVTF